MTTTILSCDACQLLRINGVVCHEPGCPNFTARWDAEAAQWVRQATCRECGCSYDAGSECCIDDYYDELNEWEESQDDD